MTKHWLALAKINKRYYWAVEDADKLFDDDADTRIEDGFAHSRENAVKALADSIERADPGSQAWLKERAERPWPFDEKLFKTGNRYGASPEAKAFYDNPGKRWSWARANTANSHFARRLYKQHHGKKPKPSNSTDARGDDLGFMYRWWEPYDYDAPGRWIAHRITKITKKKIFVLRDSYGNRQYAFDGAEVERTGRAFFRNGTGSEFFYSQAAVDAENVRRRQDAIDARSIRADETDLLGISGDCSRAEVMKAFRQKSKIFHPDHGGTNEQFRRLCEAKDNALARLRIAA